MKVRKKLISNATYLFLNWFFINFFGLVYWLVAAKILVPGEYGIVSTAFGLASLLSGITSLGLNPALSKLIPEYLARNRKNQISQLIKNSLKVLFCANLLTVLFLVIIFPILITYLKLSLEVILLSLTFLFVLSFNSIFSAIVYGLQKMRKFMLANFFGRLVKLIVAIPLIYLGFSYFGALLGILFGVLTTKIIFISTFLSSINLKLKAKINFRKIFKVYALPAFIASLALTLFSNSQYILLTLIKNPEITGIFTLAMVLTSLISSFPRILSSALFPVISYLSAFKEKIKQAHLTNLVLRYSILSSLPFVFLFIIFSKQLVLIISTEKYLEATTLFPLLTFAALINGIGNIFLSNLYAIGKTKINRNIVLLTSFSFLIFAIPLTFYFSAFGMSLAYLISTIFLLLPAYIYAKKFIPIKIPFKSFVKCVISAVISFSLLFFGVRIVTGIFDYLLGILACLLYVIILFPLKFFIKEDVEILEVFASKISFLKKIIPKIERFI